MKINVDISSEHKEPYAVIYTNEVTDDIQRMIDIFSSKDSPIIALQSNGDMVILQPSEIYMVRVENGETIIYAEKYNYRSRKRLYEIGQQLGKQFMQISMMVKSLRMNKLQTSKDSTLQRPLQVNSPIMRKPTRVIRKYTTKSCITSKNFSHLEAQ